MEFNWKKVVGGLLAFIGENGDTIIQDVEAAHGDNKSEDQKTQIAAEGIVLGSKALHQLEPNDTEAIIAVTDLAEQMVTAKKQASPVAPAVPVQVTALPISPGVGRAKPGGTIMFSAAGYDPIAKIKWAVETSAKAEGGTGGGSIEQNGIYTAGPNAGVDIISAETADGTQKGTAQANVSA